MLLSATSLDKLTSWNVLEITKIHSLVEKASLNNGKSSCVIIYFCQDLGLYMLLRFAFNHVTGVVFSR